MNEKHKLIALFILVLVFGYVSFRIVSPFLTAVVLGLLMAVLFYPLYNLLRKDTGPTIGAIICIVTVIIIIILPAIWLTTNLIAQATGAYQTVQAHGITLTSLAQYVPGVNPADLEASLFGPESVFAPGKVAALIPQLINEAWNLAIGLVIFFMVMYYALKDGGTWYDGVTKIIPIKKEYKNRLRDDIEKMTKALFYGQILNSIIIGTLSGIIFWLFGIPDPIFWGFIMMVLTFLPLFGAPIIFVPAGVILMLNNELFAGIAVIALCAMVMFLAEYIIRPKFISHSSALHPLTVIIGAIGGIYALGFVGFLIGPLILGIFITLLSFDFGIDDKKTRD